MCIASLLSIMPWIMRRAPLSQSNLCSPAMHSHCRSGVSITVQCKHPHRDALLWKTVLLLLAQHHQPTLLNEAPKDVHVPSHTAVREIEDTALPSHVVLQDDDTIFFQASSAPGKKCKKVFIGQVSYRWGQVDGEQDEMVDRREENRKVGKTTRLRIKRPFVHAFMNYLIAWIVLVAGSFENLGKKIGILSEKVLYTIYKIGILLAGLATSQAQNKLLLIPWVPAIVPGQHNFVITPLCLLDTHTHLDQNLIHCYLITWEFKSKKVWFCQ